MIVRSNDGHLDVGQALLLGVDELHRGHDPQCREEIAELIEQKWIDVATDGGWLLLPTLVPTASPL